MKILTEKKIANDIGINVGGIVYACLKMGKENVVEQYRYLWSEDHPTIGYSYVISNYLFYKHGLPAFRIEFEDRTHYFSKYYDNIVDLAIDRKFDYGNAKQFVFELRYGMGSRALMLNKFVDEYNDMLYRYNIKKLVMKKE